MPQYTRNLNDQFLKERMTVKWPWRMLVFSFIVFIASLLVYFGLRFGYKPFIEKSIAGTDAELNKLSLGIQSADQKNFINFYSQIANLKSVLGAHVTTSNLLPLLESVTHQKVVYASTNLSVPDRSLRIDGFAESYEVLSAQLALYKKASWVESVALDSSSAAEKNVKFSARIKVRNEIIHL
ncbi:MAG: hypothetical protein HYR95_02615 [Candidatus Colwellbacteria bacterium]|nr:hypothetical protein [Candidatus Colwellbacteria bacterium]